MQPSRPCVRSDAAQTSPVQPVQSGGAQSTHFGISRGGRRHTHAALADVEESPPPLPCPSSLFSPGPKRSWTAFLKTRMPVKAVEAALRRRRRRRHLEPGQRLLLPPHQEHSQRLITKRGTTQTLRRWRTGRKMTKKSKKGIEIDSIPCSTSSGKPLRIRSEMPTGH